MKKITLILVVITLSLSGFSQMSKVYKELNNPKLERKLKNFAKEGIEKNLKTKKCTADELIKNAKTYLGTPHVMGGISKKGIDCSGLLFASFKDCDVSIPRSSQAISRYGKIISKQSDLKKGDFVFFANTYKTKNVITHSGIYLGDGKFIHTSAKRGVQIVSLESKYYQEHYVFATRVW